MFFSVEEIISEFDLALKNKEKFDIVSIVGEGEPTLYLGLGKLIDEIKKRTDKPVAVITNGALLNDFEVRCDLLKADIVLPSINAYDEYTFKKINRPYPKLDFMEVFQGLKSFSKEFKGEIWLEIMFVEGINDDDESLQKFLEILKEIKYDRLYLNTPVRPPAEEYVKVISKERMEKAVSVLGGISIDLLSSKEYQSGIKDDYQAIISIIQRHPMNQFEIESFLKLRDCHDQKDIFTQLKKDIDVEVIEYKGYFMYRLK